MKQKNLIKAHKIAERKRRDLYKKQSKFGSKITLDAEKQKQNVCPPGQKMNFEKNVCVNDEGITMKKYVPKYARGKRAIGKSVISPKKPQSFNSRPGIYAPQNGDGQVMSFGVECDTGGGGGWSADAENDVAQSNLVADCLNSGGKPSLIF